jgi:hypothetical protein
MKTINAKDLARRAEAVWNNVLVNQAGYVEVFGRGNVAIGEDPQNRVVDADGNLENLKKRLESNYGEHRIFPCLGGKIDVFGEKIIMYGTIDEIVGNPLFVVRSKSAA